jgi:hypothetical protein
MSAVPLPRVLSDMIEPAFRLLPARMASDEARVMLLAIGLQESRFRHRVQLPLRPGMPPGPARGFWQFEQGGGVRGVLGHSASSRMAMEICAARGIDRPSSPVVWQALATDDVLAAGFARLLLWTDSRPLPRLGDHPAAWDYYIRNWRPGKPHPQTWRALYDSAVETVKGRA